MLGLTPTPERLDGKGLDGIFHDLLEVATVPDLIDSGFLVTPTCLGPSPEMAAQLKSALASVKVRGGDYAEERWAMPWTMPSWLATSLQHWKEWAAGQKTIVFAASILHSQHIIQQFKRPEYLPRIWTARWPRQSARDSCGSGAVIFKS
ncbi:MAG: hypothetical protein IPK63_19015 [Candidatus Competibacteraceae bacterium]|nr:hypothetical protein [Candidatus Competibacteraceae bacterium]